MAVQKFILETSEQRNAFKLRYIPNIIRANWIYLKLAVPMIAVNLFKKDILGGPAEEAAKVLTGTLGLTPRQNITVAGSGRQTSSTYDYMSQLLGAYKEAGIVVHTPDELKDALLNRTKELKIALANGKIKKIEEELAKIDLSNQNGSSAVDGFCKENFANLNVANLTPSQALAYKEFFKSVPNPEDAEIIASGVSQFRGDFIIALSKNPEIAKIRGAIERIDTSNAFIDSFTEAQLKTSLERHIDPLLEIVKKEFFDEGVLSPEHRKAMTELGLYQDTFKVMENAYNNGELSVAMSRLYESVQENNRNRELLGSYGADMIANFGEPINGVNLVYNVLADQVGAAEYSQRIGFDNKHPALWNPTQDTDMVFNLIEYKDCWRFGGQRVIHAYSFVTADDNDGAGFSSILFGNTTVVPISSKTDHTTEASPAGQWFLNNLRKLVERFGHFCDTMNYAWEKNEYLPFTISHELYVTGIKEHGSHSQRFLGESGAIRARDFIGEKTQKNYLLAFEQFINFHTSNPQNMREWEKYGVTTATFTELFNFLEMAVHMGGIKNTLGEDGKEHFSKLKNLKPEDYTELHPIKSLRDVPRGNLRTHYDFKARDSRHMQLALMSKIMFGEDEPIRTIYKMHKEGLLGKDGDLAVNYQAVSNLGAQHERELEEMRDKANSRAVENATENRKFLARLEEFRSGAKIEIEDGKTSKITFSKITRALTSRTAKVIYGLAIGVTAIAGVANMLIKKYSSEPINNTNDPSVGMVDTSANRNNTPVAPILENSPSVSDSIKSNKVDTAKTNPIKLESKSDSGKTEQSGTIIKTSTGKVIKGRPAKTSNDNTPSTKVKADEAQPAKKNILKGRTLEGN